MADLDVNQIMPRQIDTKYLDFIHQWRAFAAHHDISPGVVWHKLIVFSNTERGADWLQYIAMVAEDKGELLNNQERSMMGNARFNKYMLVNNLAWNVRYFQQIIRRFPRDYERAMLAYINSRMSDPCEVMFGMRFELELLVDAFLDPEYKWDVNGGANSERFKDWLAIYEKNIGSESASC